MVGGSGNFSYSETSQRSEFGQNSQTGYIAVLRPNVGYFLVDKIAIGAMINLTFSNPEGREDSSFGYSLGPFIRYYLLETDKMVNILTQASFSYGESHNRVGSSSWGNEYGLRAGPVIFLTQDVAMELTLEYNYSKTRFAVNSSASSSILQLGLGFQIHLERY